MLRVFTLSAAVLSCLSAGLTLGEEPSAATYRLAYQFEAGQTLEYVSEHASSIFVQVGDVADTVRNTVESGKRYEVVSVDEDGNAVLQPKIHYVRLTADHQGEHVEWDSRSREEAPAEFQSIADSLNAPLGTVQVSPAGAVTVVALRGSAADGAQLQGDQFDLFPTLPEQPITVGESWKENFEVQIHAQQNLKKKVSMQRLLTLKSVEKGRAVIDVRTLILSPIRDPLEEGQLIQRTPSGTITMDIETGKIISREMKIDKRVVGFQGPQTSLQVIGTRNESLAAEERAAGRRDSAQVQ